MQLLLFLALALGVFMTVLLIGSSVLSGITGVSLVEMGDPSSFNTNPKALTILRSMLLLQFLGLFVIPPLLFAYFSDPEPAHYLGLRAPVKPGYWVVAVAILLIAIPLVEYTGMLNRSANFGKDLQVWAQTMEEDALQTVQFLLRKGTVSHLILNLVFIAGFAAVGEELFFRGVLQRLFIRGTRSPWAGIIVAAFFFSFFHFQFFGFLPRLLLGMVLGAIFWYSGSLWTAIAAHFVYDAFIIMLIYFDPQKLQTPEAPMISASYLGIAAIASAVVAGLLIWWMKKNTTVSYAAHYSDDDSGVTEKEIHF